MYLCNLLLRSGVEPADMQTIYYYLIGTLLPAHLETELHGGSMPRNNQSPFSVHYGRFITGPSNLKDSNIGKVPKIYINNDSKQSAAYHLVVYRSLSASICLFIDGKYIVLIINYFAIILQFGSSR